MSNQQYKILPALFIFLLFGVFAYSQGVISGRVITDDTEQPLSGASVYINSSTIGTITNENGSFRLPIASNGFYDVVVSYVGYEIIVYRATIQSRDLSITFKLHKKAAELRNVVVLSKDSRARWLQIFRENFLGQTMAAGKCTIRNEDEILFENGNRDSLKAYSLVPLEIVNKELGYRIFFELEGFYFNSKEHRTYFYGYSRMEELTERDKVPAKYLRNRERYYRGSTMHFYHSLIDNNLKEQGFDLLNIRNIAGPDSAMLSKTPNVIVKNGSINVQKQDQLFAGFKISRDDIFSRDSVAGNAVYVLNWKERLRVIYNKDPYGKEFLKKKFFLQGGQAIGVNSDMEMLESPAYMDGNGSLYNPLALQVSGYWSYEKLANMLPINYRPSK